MNEDQNQHQQPAELAADVNKEYLDLHPYAELAKYVMDSPVCEINITDTYTSIRRSIALNLDDSLHNDRLYNDTINQDGIYEIEDLSKDTRYQDHSYVTESPHFRYYCGAKLATANGRDIGSICVLDTTPKRVSSEQKTQLQQLVCLVVKTLEHESRYRNIITKFEAVNDRFHKLNHDLRTPISGIVGVSDLLMKKKDHVACPTRELTLIKRSAKTILNVVDQVLEDVKARNNGHEKQEEIRLDIIIDQLEHLYHPPAKTKGISLTFTNQLDTSLKVPHSFALKLLQIVGNLLSNAVKFTPENGVVEVTIHKDTEKHETVLGITVTNTGKSMSADQIAAFNNGGEVTRSAGTNGEQSFGVGLEHVKQVVARACGTISVKGGQTDGTKFTISLPVPVDKANTNKSMSSLLEDIPKPKSNGIK